MDRFIREKELRKVLGVSRTTIWRWERAGKLPAHLEIGGVAVWSEAQIVAWMAVGGGIY